MHSKKCSNCGADNDPIFTNCKFCKSPLPEIDLNSISNENLIQNAAEWIGKMGTDFEVTGPNTNMWTGRDYRRYEPNEIDGYAFKYLTLLQVRSANNIDILNVYNSLRERYDNNRNNVLVKIGGGNKRIGILWIFLIGVAIFIIIMVVFLK
jgi:hypothetical protein